MLLVVIINCNTLFYRYVLKNGNTKEEITTFLWRKEFIEYFTMHNVVV